MEQKTPERVPSHQKRSLNVGLVMSLLALWARQANRVSKKLKPGRFGHKKTVTHKLIVEDQETWSPRSVPRSPLRAKPKELLTSISGMAMTLVHRVKNPDGEMRGGGGTKEKTEDEEEKEEEYGLWQRTILMGGKCQPLDFSGVIYYDSQGRQLKDVPPRSPRASPLPPYLVRN